MPRRICIINGHPDPCQTHFAHALAETYAMGARSNSHAVDIINAATLSFPWIENKGDFQTSSPPPDILKAQEAIKAADHIVIIFPLWLGGMPAFLKAFLEQVLRPGFAVDYKKGGMIRKRLKGRSVRVIITMAMPVWAYKYYYGAHSLKAIKVGILRFCGLSPIRTTLIGAVESPKTNHIRWLTKIGYLGRRAA